MDMFSLSREAAAHGNMERKTSGALDPGTARKQSNVYDRRQSGTDRRQSYATFNAFRDEQHPAVRDLCFYLS